MAKSVTFDQATFITDSTDQDDEDVERLVLSSLSKSIDLIISLLKNSW